MSYETWGDPPEPPPMGPCPDCDGAGEIEPEDFPPHKCERCDGEGEVEIPDTRFEDDVI